MTRFAPASRAASNTWYVPTTLERTMVSAGCRSPAAAARCTIVSTPSKAGRMALRSPRSAGYVSTPGTARRFSARSAYLPSACARNALPMRPLRPVTRTRRGVMSRAIAERVAELIERTQLALQLPIDAEVRGHRRPPPIERVLRREITRLPRARLGNVIDVVKVFRPRAPRVAHVVEEVGANDVAPEPPADRDARVVRALHAHCDLVDAADLKRPVVKAGPLGREQREVVMISGAAQERDDAGTTVGELHAEHTRVEVDHALEIPREQEDVAEPSRAGLETIGAAARGDPRRVAGAVHGQRGIRRRHL